VEAEQMGLDSWGLVTPRDFATVYDPIETLPFTAARTLKVKLGTSVMSALFQNPTLARRLPLAWKWEVSASSSQPRHTEKSEDESARPRNLENNLF